MNNNSTGFNYKKFWTIFIALGIFIAAVIAAVILFAEESAPHYPTIQECIHAEIEDEIRTDHSFTDPEQSLTYKSKLISFENEKQYCEFYSSLNDTVWFIIIDKIETEEGIQYSCADKMTYLFYSDDAYNIEGYDFQCADSPDQIEIEGAELNEITFTLNGETYTRILAFKDNSANYSGE